MKKVLKYKIFLYIFGVIIIVSCSSSARYKILSSIFDGVPDPNARQKEISDSLKTDSLLTKKKLVTARNKKPSFIYHPPYQNRLCKACHNISRGNKLLKPVPELCFKCHEDITAKNPVIHGPVAMGDCVVCHSPHLAKYKFLLKRKGNALCHYCHNQEDLSKNKMHFAIEEHDCLDCHNPHSGKDRFLLN